MGKLLSEVDKRGIKNLKVFAEDAVQVLEGAIPPQSIDLLQIFFPDPWHKKRHHKRRLIQLYQSALMVTLLMPWIWEEDLQQINRLRWNGAL